MLLRGLVATAFAALLLACSPAQKTQALANGQLFCQIETKAGPVIVAVATAAGAPVIATGLAQGAVAAICAGIQAIPVPPPAAPASVPVMVAPVVVPAATVIP